MNLIFGGAYQGKLAYAKNKIGADDRDVFVCQKDNGIPKIDFNNRIIYGLENFTFACVKNGIEAKDYLEANIDKLKEATVICTDISQGVVPMDKDLRAWREMNGRAMIYLNSRADSVTRVFCGIPQIIK